MLNINVEPALSDQEDDDGQESGDKEDVKGYFKADVPRIFSLVCHINSPERIVNEV